MSWRSAGSPDAAESFVPSLDPLYWQPRLELKEIHAQAGFSFISEQNTSWKSSPNTTPATEKHQHMTSASQVVLTCPSLCILFGNICLVMKKDLGRFYITQGNSQVQQGPASWVALINILWGIQERNNAEAALSNASEHTKSLCEQSLAAVTQESIFPHISPWCTASNTTTLHSAVQPDFPIDTERERSRMGPIKPIW